MPDFIPVSVPALGDEEKRNLVACIETGWISSEGPFVKEFEEKFAASVGATHGVACTNGTDALRLAVAALRIGPGDEVIVPTFTIISCVQAVIDAGATPVLVDCDPVTWNMDMDQVEARITPRTKAVMAVHIYGLPVDMDRLLDLAERNGFMVIEDAAEAIGLDHRDRPCGGMGTVGVFSFYANKLVTTGEGGMVVTNDAAVAERCRSKRNLCFGAKRFVHEELGWNMRMTNLQAAVGLGQLARLGETVARKRAVGRRLTEKLSGLSGVRLPPERTETAGNVYWVYGLVLEDEVPFDAAEAMARLRDEGIGTRPFFHPMHQQPALLERGLFRGESHPVAEAIGVRGFYVPSSPGLTDEEVDRIAAAVRSVVSRA